MRAAFVARQGVNLVDNDGSNIAQEAAAFIRRE